MKRSPIKHISCRQQAELKARRILKAQLVIESGGRCQECGNAPTWEGLDLAHVIPLSRGGKTERSNVKVLCRSCHRKLHHLR